MYLCMAGVAENSRYLRLVDSVRIKWRDGEMERGRETARVEPKMACTKVFYHKQRNFIPFNHANPSLATNWAKSLEVLPTL